MTLRVIGAGVGRTGTHSLKEALEKLLGGTCHHMIEVFAHPEEVPVWTDAIEGRPVDWPALLSGYVAQVDWPGASFWPELHAAFPDALVLLSVRDPESWYKSAMDTIFAGMAFPDEQIGPWMVSMKKLIADRFCAELDDKDAAIAALERHNEAVRAAIPASHLLEWSAADGWGPICERLEVPVPDEPFPVTNTTADFRAMIGLPPL
ncbi:MAG TPA: sulfotransferase [Acidimicrobiales bacterium]|nr:sulfotransferase [Acidimicrobiales bacterium]